MKNLILILAVMFGSQVMADDTTANREPANESATVNMADPEMNNNRGTELQGKHVSEIGCPECLRQIGRSNIGESAILREKYFYNLLPEEQTSVPASLKQAPAGKGVQDKISPPKKK
jgi:hypothetical protein